MQVSGNAELLNAGITNSWYVSALVRFTVFGDSRLLSTLLHDPEDAVNRTLHIICSKGTFNRESLHYEPDCPGP